MLKDIENILFSEEMIAEKVRALASRIMNDYAGKNLLVIGVLKGANVFLCDLIRKIELPIRMDFIAASSYGNSSTSSGVVKIEKDLDFPIDGYDVLVVEDIIDTGLTLHYLVENLKSRNPNSVEVISLLDKPERRKIEVDVKYVGFTVPDVFIVGYGIDYAEKYRNLPYIASLKESVYKKN